MEIEQLSEDVTVQKEKLKGVQHKIQSIIDKLIDIYTKAQASLNQSDSSEQIILLLQKQLQQVRPLKTVRDVFSHHYRKLSNLQRKLSSNNLKTAHSFSKRSKRGVSEYSNLQSEGRDTEDRITQLFKTVISNQQQHNLLKEMIVQSYIRAQKGESSAAFGELSSKVDPDGILKQSVKLKNEIKNSCFGDAISWGEKNVLHKNDDSQVIFQLKLAQILTLSKTEPIQVIFNLYKTSFTTFWPKKEEELGKLGVYLTMKFGIPIEMDQQLQQKITQRYKQFSITQNNLEKLSQEFIEVYFKHYCIPKSDPLKSILDCSQKVAQQYQRKLKLLGNNNKDKMYNKTLPFSVSIPKEHQHHSLFFCPITKQVHSSQQTTVLLFCGHLISEGAYSRIIEQSKNRRKIKCPICQKQFKPDDILRCQF